MAGRVDGAVTVNPLVFLPACPSGFVTVTFHGPGAAPVTGITQVINVELTKRISVADMFSYPVLVRVIKLPSAKLMPDRFVMLTGFVFNPEDGVRRMIAGRVDGVVTVNPLVFLPACPSGFVTVTFHGPGAAPVIGRTQVINVELTKRISVADMFSYPVLVRVIKLPSTKLMPDRFVMLTGVVFNPEDGVRRVMAGRVDGAVTVNPLVFLPACPSGFVTVTFHGPGAAPVTGITQVINVELMKRTSVAEMFSYPVLVRVIKLPSTKLIPDRFVMLT